MVVGVPCVTSQVTPSFCKSLVSVTLKGCCSPVGTVAVTVLKVTTMPESRVSVAVPVLAVSAAALAVITMESVQDCDDDEQLLPGSFAALGT